MVQDRDHNWLVSCSFSLLCISLIGRATVRGGKKADLLFTPLLNDLCVVHVSNVVKC